MAENEKNESREELNKNENANDENTSSENSVTDSSEIDEKNEKDQSSENEMLSDNGSAEKEEAGSAEKTDKKNNDTLKYCLSIAVPLLIICSVIAMLMALVNGITIDRINENSVKATNEAINRIYPAFDKSEMIVEAPELPVTDVFRLDKDGDVLGYCVAVQPKGFNGAIEMMVGISPKGIITGVEIISHSETPGVGARADDPAYLDQYDGLSGRLSFGEGIDALSGATISSRAILSGVNAASAIVSEITGGIYDNGDETDPDVSEAENEAESDEEAGK